MNGRFQMQGGKNWMDFAERGEFKPVFLRLSLAGNLVKPLISLCGAEWREHVYGLRGYLLGLLGEEFSIGPLGPLRECR